MFVTLFIDVLKMRVQQIGVCVERMMVHVQHCAHVKAMSPFAIIPLNWFVYLYCFYLSCLFQSVPAAKLNATFEVEADENKKPPRKTTSTSRLPKQSSSSNIISGSSKSTATSSTTMTKYLTPTKEQHRTGSVNIDDTEFANMGITPHPRQQKRLLGNLIDE